MKTTNKYVGLDIHKDTHKDTIVVSVAEDGRSTQFQLKTNPPTARRIYSDLRR
jgi:hypothetical protein